MSKIKIYDFIDTETGDKFSGTKKELAKHAGIVRQTVDTRIRAGRIIAKQTGEIDNLPKTTFTRIVDGKADVFVGFKTTAARHYNLTEYALRREIAEGRIIMDDRAVKADLERKKKSNPLHFITDKKSDPETKRKLTKQMYDVIHAMGM
jgi:hypothetical protein